MNPKEFSNYVRSIREAEKQLGSDKKKVQLEEKKFIILARKSITLRKSMKRGDILKEKDIIMKRTGSGFNGQKISRIIGKKLRTNVKKATATKWSHFI